MHKYTHVILDEIHEREVDMDLLMTIVREFLLANSMETKVILMSATFDPEIFVEYFTFNVDLKPAVIKLKTKRSFKIDKMYLDDITLICSEFLYHETSPGISNNMYHTAKDIILKRLSQSNNNILVFLPGIFEIESLNAILSIEPEIQTNALVCLLHSSLATKDQRAAFMPASKPKIILSTNIAESSVTISSVDCVIDFCLTKYIQQDKSSKTSIGTLKLDWASQNSLEQRAGRTGRTCDGIVYQLIYRRFYDCLSKCITPEMQRCPLETVVLRVKMLDETLIPVEFLPKVISPPLPKDIRESIKSLKELGAMERLSFEGKFTSNDGKLTYIGRIMAALPLDVRITKLIITGYMFSVLDEAIIIAAGLNNKSIFSFRCQERFEIYKQKLKWADGSGCDMIAILNAYKLWQFKKEQGHFAEYKQEIKWCNYNNLELKSLMEMRELIREIKERLSALKLEKHSGVSWEANEKPLILKICFAGTFMPNWHLIGSPSEAVEGDVYKTTVARDPANIVYYREMKSCYIGEVYESQLKDHLVAIGICRRAEDVKVIFVKGSSKVFIQFIDEKSSIDDKNYDETNYEAVSPICVAGKIKLEVYKAVKIRQLGERFEIKVMSEEKTEEWAKQHGLEGNERDVFERPPGLMTHPELCVLPSTCTGMLWGKVSHIEHCGKFYIQPSSTDLLDQIKNLLNPDKLMVYQTISQLTLFQQVVVYDSDEILKRAKAVGFHKDSQIVKCFMFDYGETKEFRIADVYGLTDNIHHREAFKIPERCFEASLSEIAPSFIKCPKGKWTKEAIEMFRKLTFNRELKVKVYSVVYEIASVELWIDNLSINNKLINAGFAQANEESYPSKHNHELRKSIQESHGEANLQFEAAVEFASRRDTLVTKYVPPPPIKLCNKKLSLKGPISPLETSPTSILVNNNSSCSIDSLSVNSVLLYEDPGNVCGRLLVAASANENRREVVLHGTSTMPDVPGLPVLLALIFAPDAILNRNNDKTMYESLQFGLGCDSVGVPYFSQHDCILPVNIDLTYEDYRDINYLRFFMSYLLMTKPTEVFPSLIDSVKLELFTNIKQYTLKILGKKRSPLPSKSVSNMNGRWFVYKDDMEIYDDEELLYNGGLYHMLPRPVLQPLDETKKQKLLEKLREAKLEVKL